MTERHAEVERIWPRDGRIRVEGGWHGIEVTGDESWRADLVLRGERPQELGYPAVAGPDGFTFTVPVDELITPWLRAAPPDHGQVWEVHLTRESDGLRLRVGRHLDDIPDKREIFVYPLQRPSMDAGLIVRPIFTARNWLGVRCRRPRGAAGGQ